MEPRSARKPFRFLLRTASEGCCASSSIGCEVNGGREARYEDSCDTALTSYSPEKKAPFRALFPVHTNLTVNCHVLKKAYTGLAAILFLWAAVATISSTGNELIKEKLATSMRWLWSFVTSTVQTPAWILVSLVLLAFGLGLALLLVLSRRQIIKRTEPKLEDLSKHELRVVQTLISLDTKRITRDEVSAELKISNLEASAALSKLEEKGLIDSFHYAGFEVESSYGFSDEGTIFASAIAAQLQELIQKGSL